MAEMAETEVKPELSRDEILQSHLVAIREEIHALPGRVFAWFFWTWVLCAIIVGLGYIVSSG
jgi:hypothetical protein